MKGFLSVTYRDAFQQETTRSYELVEANGGTKAEDLAELRNNAEAILGELILLSGAEIVATALNVTDAEFDGAFLSAPQTGSNVSDDGVLSVALAGGGKGTLRVPSPRSTVVDAFGSPVVASFLNFAGQFLNGGVGLLSDGEAIDDTSPNNGILKTWRASRGRRNS